MEPVLSDGQVVTPARRDPDWFKRAVFYEVLVRGFADSNGDGTGDLRGLADKLDYLQWLGVDCLWLPPFFSSPLRDGGYDVSDYTGVLPEFGTIDDDVLVIDEMCTSDSSRYWSADEYRVDGSPPSFDKQFVRDHYLGVGWNQVPPAPPLPADVIDGTRARYVEAYEMLTGVSFDEWYGVDG